MVALPCGSRSSINTRWPTLASPAARLTVVVVLPTPPFWLATQKIFAISQQRTLWIVGQPTGANDDMGRGSLRDGEFDAEAHEAKAGQLLQRTADEWIRAHALGQMMREQDSDQTICEGQRSYGGRHDGESEYALVARRIHKQREERHVKDDRLRVQKRY